MPISKEDILLIKNLFFHLNGKGLESIQIYNPVHQFSVGRMITAKKNNDGTCNGLYFNLANYNNWHQKIIEKKSKKISAQMTIQYFESEKITRIIFFNQSKISSK